MEAFEITPTVKPPKLKSEDEDFNAYLLRWPKQLSNVPEDVIKNWAFVHNQQVIEFCSSYDLSAWRFKLEKFDNDEILKISHFKDELEKIDGKSFRLFTGELNGYDTADFMLQHGTFPCPIIVAHNAGNIVHHRSTKNETMIEPYHLIEGNRRLGFIREMIRTKYENLKSNHEVWVVSIDQ